MGAASIQEPGTWTAALSHRWQYSDRHYVGNEEQVFRAKEGSSVINDVHLIDISASYVFTKRLSATLSIPIQWATRSQAVTDNRRNPDGTFVNPSPYRGREGEQRGAVVDRYETSAAGLGDIKLLGTAWVFDPEEHTTQNLSIGLGVLFPTGEKDVEDTFTVFATDAAGNYRPRAEKRHVDNSIQPGAGAWGAIFDIYGFKQVFTNFTLFAAGTYIFVPEEDANVWTGANNTGRVWAVGDSYLGRAGAGWTFWPKYGLTLTFGGRVEGTPPEDLIGADGGRRRPGFAVSVEPGIVFAKNGWFASFSMPVAVYRERQHATIDDPAEPPGDAAFADFMTLFTVGRNF